MRRTLYAACATIGLLAAAGSAGAATVYWADWTSVTADATTGLFTVDGTITVGSTVIGVRYSGALLFAQTGFGVNFWDPAAPYLSAAVSNAPPAAEMIGLFEGGAKTITFSQAVIDPLLALVSWNGNVVDFGTPIELLSGNGVAGYWGSGSAVINSEGTGFTGFGEFHGVIRLPGTTSSITFTDTTEWWHGFTVGILGLDEPPPPPPPPIGVPEPGTLGLLGLGLAGLAFARSRRRR